MAIYYQGVERAPELKKTRQPMIFMSLIDHLSFFLPSITSCIMTRGCPFSDDLCQVLVYMGTQHSFQEVMKSTAVPQSTLYALYSEYKKNGHVLHVKPATEVRGRKRKMNAGDAQVRPFYAIVFTHV